MSVLGLGEGVSDPIDRPRPAFEAFDPHTVVWIQDRMTQTRRILPPACWRCVVRIYRTTGKVQV